MLYAIIGVIVVLAIVPFFRLLTFISKRRNRRTPREVADMIEKHIDGTEGSWDWDEFTSVPIADDRLDAIRIRFLVGFDSNLSEEKLRDLREIVQRLRNEND
jgi:hypothetical protein